MSKLYQWLRLAPKLGTHRLLLLVLTLSLSLVSFLGGYSAVLILSDPDNINVPTTVPAPDGNLTLYDPSTYDKMSSFDHVFFELPFNITNAGYFDIENLQIGLSVEIEYERIPGNIPTRILILDHTETFPLIERGAFYSGVYSAYYNTTDPLHDGFNFDDLPDKANINLLATPIFSYRAEITLTCKYSLSLLSLRVTVAEFPIPSDIF